MSLCKSFERLHCDGFRGRDYLLNHWHLHVIVDDDKLLRPLTDGVDVKVESEVSDQSPGVLNRAVDLMRTGFSEKSRTDFMKLNCSVVFVVFVQPVKSADEEFGRGGFSLYSTAQHYAHRVMTSYIICIPLFVKIF